MAGRVNLYHLTPRLYSAINEATNGVLSVLGDHFSFRMLQLAWRNYRNGSGVYYRGGNPMCRASFFACTLLMSGAAFGQNAPPEPQTTQALLGEIRQLRQDLQNVAATIQRVQIVMYRLQAETTLLNHATERLENARVTCSQAQGQRKYVAAQLEQAEARQRNSQSPSDQRVAEGMLAQLKSSAEVLADAEQECRTNEIDAQAQLRTEQAKMDDLQDQLDKLDKVLASYRGK